jgi:hypothetical protein
VEAYSVHLPDTYNKEERNEGRETVVRSPKQTKRTTGTVGEGAADKKAKATQHAGGQSVSEKSQATRTSKNVFEKSIGAEHHTGDYVKNKAEEVLLKLGIAKVGHDDGIFQKVADNDSNMVKDWHSLPCIDHTVERSIRMLLVEPKVKESFDKGKKVVTFFKSSTIGHNDLAKVKKELYTRVQQVPLDTDPLMWWKQHVQEFPRLTRMARQHLAVPATSASPERLFSSVGLVKSDLRGSLLDTTLIDVMWAKQAP